MLWIAVFVVTLVAMEGFAHLMHKYVMHGPLWILHKSHHEPKHDHLVAGWRAEAANPRRGATHAKEALGDHGESLCKV